jgi:uncharacterized protein YjbI with pentapeptide repeats
MAQIEHIKQLCLGVEAWNDYYPRASVTADFSHAEFRNADFRNADFSGANFDGSRMHNVDFRDANLEGALLNGVTGTNVHFGNANLHRGELKGTDLTRANFQQAVLNDSIGLDFKLRHGNCRESQFRRCRLDSTHFYNCDLTGADVRDGNWPHSLFKRPVIEAEQQALLEEAGCRFDLVNQPHQADWMDWTAFDVRQAEVDFGAIIYEGRAYWISENRSDFFISHASADKDAVARPLAQALRQRNLRVWFDEQEIKAGDRLDDLIAQGTRECVFGIVVASPKFFGRQWTEAEMDLLEGKRLFLVLHEMSIEELRNIRPALAMRRCLYAAMGPEGLADALLEAAQQPGRFF